jgi:hypothetical protein
MNDILVVESIETACIGRFVHNVIIIIELCISIFYVKEILSTQENLKAEHQV